MNTKISVWTLAPLAVAAVGCGSQGVSPRVKTPGVPDASEFLEGGGI